MRLVIDMQGAQGTSSRRGIGRFSLALAKSMARLGGRHEVVLALSSAFPDSIDPIRSGFQDVVPRDHIVVWDSLQPVAAQDAANQARKRAAEIVRESFLASLNPDVVHVSSLFEGWADDAVTSVRASAERLTTAVTLYDLIPLIHRDKYLSNPDIEKWYLEKIDHLSRSRLCLAISEASRLAATDLLGIPPERVVSVSAAADERFRPVRLAPAQSQEVRRQYGLVRPFVMYTGGIDQRKNVEGMVSAFSRLPTALRSSHQLAIVCEASAESVTALRRHGRRSGLTDDDLVITGYVPDDHLVALYNLCAVFCFPSLHEGFGLPALEAMQCGAPTIGSNVASVPEVIGRADALFDPRDEASLAGRLHQVLSDEAFRRSLKEHALVQSRKFSWEESARRAWAALESLNDDRRERAFRLAPVVEERRLRLAYVSPVPPARTGIANYSAELIPALARHYDIDVVVAQEEVSDQWVKENCTIRDSRWFMENGQSYDRILYQFGNSVFHSHMFDLLDTHPGVVTLHDFYLSGIAAHLSVMGFREGFWEDALYRSHGYVALYERYQTREPWDLIRKYPASFPVLARATGIIVHSQFAKRLAAQFYDNAVASGWHVIPTVKRVPDGDRSTGRSRLGFAPDDFLVCAFGVVDSTKLNHRLLNAWVQSSLSKDSRCHLLLVGESPNADYSRQLRRSVARSAGARRVHFTGYVDSATYEGYLLAADVAVQLRTLSRGETSAATMDCMAHGLPIVANAHGPMTELPRDLLVLLDDEFSDQELVAELQSLRADPERRTLLGDRARSYAREHLSPEAVAQRYRQAIEASTAGRGGLPVRTIRALGAIGLAEQDAQTVLQVARSVSHNLLTQGPQKQLFVDVSVIQQEDAHTGVQRVVRSLLRELTLAPPAGYRTEPVYSLPSRTGYRYARRFTSRILGCPYENAADSPIEVTRGDIFLGLDLHHALASTQPHFFRTLRDRGVSIHFVVYDLLPIVLQEHFAGGPLRDLHEMWLKAVSQHADGLLCISRSVANEVRMWSENSGLARARPLRINWFHLGADIANSSPTFGLPDDAARTLELLARRPTFLMVGRIQVHKGHRQALDAFETLWGSGADVNLVIVGKPGWNSEALVARLRAHRELNQRLFWLEGVSDEYLERVYALSTCLLVPSEGEGFGLPLIEAARHEVPILARDIPIFREVAGDHATYFSGLAPSDLAHAIERWLAEHAQGVHARSDGLPWITWKESARQLLAALFEGREASRGSLADRGVVESSGVARATGAPASLPVTPADR